ncbi:MAG: alpha-E domain-containing protein [Methylococcaceae bacterium]|nr:alpha-E domain-containing protein [Methylococcaceae bacterium]
MLLSRVAERIYWLARYLERAQNTTQLINVQCHVILDLPFGTELGWETILSITSTESSFFSRYKNLTERNIVKFMLVDLDNPGSIMTSLRNARENIRTTRDILPFVLWEEVNALYLYANDNVAASLARRDRYKFLENIRCGCQQIAGLLERNLNRDEIYDFIKLGSHIERADMTTRILDVAASSLLNRDRSASAIDDLLWMSVLKSLQGLTMYRRHYGPKVIAEDVVQFVLTHRQYPCAVGHSMQQIESLLATLKNHGEAKKIIQSMLQKLEDTDFSLLLEEPAAEKGLHSFLDHIQIGLIELHNKISHTWFEHEP